MTVGWALHKAARARQRSVARAVVLGLFLLGLALRAQVPLAGVGTRIQINGSDLAVLEAQDASQGSAVHGGSGEARSGFRFALPRRLRHQRAHA